MMAQQLEKWSWLKLGSSRDGNVSLWGRFGLLATSPLDARELSAFWGSHYDLSINQKYETGDQNTCWLMILGANTTQSTEDYHDA